MAHEEQRTSKYPEYDGKTAADLAREMKKVGTALDDAATAKTALQERYDFLRMQALPTRMEDEGLEILRIDGVGRVSLTSDMWISIAAQSKNKAYEWLEQSGHGDIIVPQVNASSLKAMIKKCVVDGVPIPTDLFKIQPYTRASITKA